MTAWLWPLPGVKAQIPVGNHDGAFGKRRRFDMHTGVDLYCPEHQKVTAVEGGRVVTVEQFTGRDAGSPWWLPTSAVLVEGNSGVILYGEVAPGVHEGMPVKAGEVLGTVMRVRPYRLKNLFNWKPHTMLHFERYTAGTTRSVWWHHDHVQPQNLVDPTIMLLASVK
jgi:murein DD-endopeptidase MepM/ murein hydrolase activator NlpD